MPAYHTNTASSYISTELKFSFFFTLVPLTRSVSGVLRFVAHRQKKNQRWFTNVANVNSFIYPFSYPLIPFHGQGSGIHPGVHSGRTQVVAKFDLNSVRSGFLLLYADKQTVKPAFLQTPSEANSQQFSNLYVALQTDTH